MIGEWGSAVGKPTIEKIDENDVVTLEQARAALMPLLHPLGHVRADPSLISGKVLLQPG